MKIEDLCIDIDKFAINTTDAIRNSIKPEFLKYFEDNNEVNEDLENTVATMVAQFNVEIIKIFQVYYQMKITQS